MKVLHVIADMDPVKGGVCQAVRTIIAGLAEVGVYNEVVSLDEPNSAFLATDDFVVNALGLARGHWQYHPRLAPWLTENLERFDKVIVHGLWLYSGYAVQVAFRRLRQRRRAGQGPQLYVMPHGMLDSYLQTAPGRGWKVWRNTLYWHLEKRLIEQADAVLFTCETERLMAWESYRPYAPRHEAVVGLGVEEPPAYRPAMREAFRAHCSGLGDAPYLLFLGRLHEKKGVDLLVQAYAGLAGGATPAAVAALPKLVVAGPGLNTPYGQLVQQLAFANPALRTAIFFPGMLTHDAKWGAYYGTDLFVLPSHQENFGIAVVEALACRRPVLITEQINIWREVVAGGGALVAADTTEGTRSALSQWLDLPKAEQQLAGEQARHSFEQQFALGPATVQLLAALEV
ncbi:glycosyl transferase family 1 [Hymenobacter amundsenii]|uniref:Glycosyl transferase family 1 n=1 Tax=Hymenobacter amundsenii TaxID=2006685 RepID=A0A246FHE0_9BACT|nr:glycosyltransferase [Hymenobacter amundsenii]OWP61946.1 glycosyl transferase family 1 [Hymenobacter amundsenii]